MELQVAKRSEEEEKKDNNDDHNDDGDAYIDSGIAPDQNDPNAICFLAETEVDLVLKLSVPGNKQCKGADLAELGGGEKVSTLPINVWRRDVNLCNKSRSG